jgi:hypothetical protein
MWIILCVHHQRKCTKYTVRDYAALRTRKISLALVFSGHRIILETFPPACREVEVPIELDRDVATKTLGL